MFRFFGGEPRLTVRRVGLDYHVEAAEFFHSVPHTFIRAEVDVRVTAPPWRFSRPAVQSLGRDHASGTRILTESASQSCASFSSDLARRDRPAQPKHGIHNDGEYGDQKRDSHPRSEARRSDLQGSPRWLQTDGPNSLKFSFDAIWEVLDEIRYSFWLRFFGRRTLCWLLFECTSTTAAATIAKHDLFRNQRRKPCR
jgi:hypothetical protein